MGATQRPTTTPDIVRAVGAIDDALAGIRPADDQDLRHVRSVIFGLRDQIAEAVTMAVDHMTPRIFWRDGERWLEFQPGIIEGDARRMTEQFPNLERLWLDTHEAEVMAAKAFAARFPGRKVRF